MSAMRFTYRVVCPECEERMRAETASPMAAVDRQHLENAPRVSRHVVPLRHRGR